MCTLTLVFRVTSVFCAGDPPCSCGQRQGLILDLKELMGSCGIVSQWQVGALSESGKEKKHVSEIKVILTTWRGERGKKGSWKWERIKSERKLTQGHFRQWSCDINIYFKKKKNRNCCPVTLKVISTSCGFVRPRGNDSEEGWDGYGLGSTIRHVYSLVSLDICSKFRLSWTELALEFSLAVTSGSS